MEFFYIIISMIILFISLFILAKAYKIKKDAIGFDDLSQEEKKAFMEFYWKD